MKKLISMLVVLFAMQSGAFAASSDLWCVGSASKGECISATGAIIPAVDGTHNLGSAAKSFGSMWVDGTATIHDLIVTGTLSPYSTGTFTGEDISLTYGIAAATGVFSGAVSAASYGAVSATSGAFSTTLGVTGNVTLGADNYKSTMTASNGNWAITGSVTAASFAGSGASLTAIPAAQIAAGNMVVGVAVFLSADCEALTPSAVGQFCFNTASTKLNISTSAAAGGFEPLH